MLPEPQIPFPVSTDHRVRPDLVRLEGPAFLIDQEYEAYAKQKLVIQNTLPYSALLSDQAEPDAVFQALRWLWKQIPKDHLYEPLERSFSNSQGVEEIGSIPANALAVDKELAAIDQYEQFDTLDDILQFGKTAAQMVQDDLVLMHREILEAAWVCFPSNWNPLEKIGKSFADIHSPVPHSEKLHTAQHNLTRAMSQKGPYIRYVWALSLDPALSQHPDRPDYLAANQVYFRTERQVTLPLPELERSWFLIRVYMAPVEQVVNTSERKRQLREALQTMPAELRAYKGGTFRAYEKLLANGFF